MLEIALLESDGLIITIAGAKALANIEHRGFSGVEYIVINTDACPQ